MSRTQQSRRWAGLPRQSTPRASRRWWRGRVIPLKKACYSISKEPSTTLADLFMPFRFGDLSSAVRASLRSWLNDEIDDGLAHGRQARLRRWTVDSFFSVPLVRDGDTGGMRKRNGHERMTMQALPGSSLEVIKPEFLFQLLMGLFEGRSWQGLHRHALMTISLTH